VDAIEYSNDVLGFEARRRLEDEEIGERRELAAEPSAQTNSDDFRYAVVSILFSVHNYT